MAADPGRQLNFSYSSDTGEFSLVRVATRRWLDAPEAPTITFGGFEGNPVMSENQQVTVECSGLVGTNGELLLQIERINFTENIFDNDVSIIKYETHVGIQGDDNVDKLAKAIQNRASSSRKLICWSDLKLKVKVYIHTIWQENWDAEGQISSTKNSPTWGKTSAKEVKEQLFVPQFTFWHPESVDKLKGPKIYLQYKFWADKSYEGAKFICRARNQYVVDRPPLDYYYYEDMLPCSQTKSDKCTTSAAAVVSGKLPCASKLFSLKRL
ncbi:hypothetical protein PoB_005644300 [Plakobranchus ocellatus]|uniref:Uncharacterized protein n=1 Tax=Plakobranchus ocellatus TaxID=259542 RepID=A0AAV4CG04_9GAST|nr:hypothetical protein PoB_005644300 [Plakobranchus ocellatus]